MPPVIRVGVPSRESRAFLGDGPAQAAYEATLADLQEDAGGHPEVDETRKED